MAHHKSAIKRIQTNKRNQMRNRHYKSMLKTHIKNVRAAQNQEQGETMFRATSSLLDKMVNKGMIHRNKAANQKSKLASVVKKLGESSQQAEA